MLCPEVWNFKAPESSFIEQKSHPDDSNYLGTIQDFPYNHLVSVVLPDIFKVPESLRSVLSNDCDYYKLNQVKLSEFVAEDFIQNFVNSGKLYVLSRDSRLDCDNCISITPSGKLLLNLDKTTYETLGLQGVVSHFQATTSARYIVAIDLKQKLFKKGKPNYERTLKRLDTLCFNFIITWEPPNEDICPSSIAKYFAEIGYSVSLCEISSQSHTVYSVKVPHLEGNSSYDIVEWLGMIALEADITNGSEYVSSYETPEPNYEVGQVRFMQWRGFFTVRRISALYKELRQLKKVSDCEWVAMYVQGFSDSPIAWQGEEHHFYTNGDNSYTFILANDTVLTCRQKCSRKRYNNKRKGKSL